jgi:apolipoprotein N-acyltransferase
VTRPILPFWAAVIVALGCGPIMAAGFPGKDWWPLTFVGIGLVLVILVGRRGGSALLIGFLAGLSFYVVHIQWATLFLGLLPMSALAVLESLFFSVGALSVALAYRWLPRVWSSELGRLALLPTVIAGLWTAREAIASVWPYGGFAWGRVALSQSQSPINSLFGWVGVSGVSFIMVFVVALAIEVARLAKRRHWQPTHNLRLVTIAWAAIVVVLAIPAWPALTSGSIRVAAVQGNGKAGYFDRRHQGDLLTAQVEATLPLVGQDVDVVLWPEGGTDIDPLVDDYAAAVFDQVSTLMHAPLVSGAITTNADGTKIYNSSLLWEAGRGAVDIYNKRHPVPFGEYIPDRAFWRPFAPDLIDLVQREYTIGTTDAVFDIDGVIAGINICFDISDDQLMTESVRDGAQVLFAQSNNADFGRTDEGLQQLAIARVRAIELGRSVVNISTVGTSAIIRPDGSTLDQLTWYAAAAMVDDVPTSESITPAFLLSRQIEWLVSGVGLAGLFVAGFAGRKRVPKGRRVG